MISKNKRGRNLGAFLYCDWVAPSWSTDYEGKHHTVSFTIYVYKTGGSWQKYEDIFENIPPTNCVCMCQCGCVHMFHGVCGEKKILLFFAVVATIPPSYISHSQRSPCPTMSSISSALPQRSSARTTCSAQLFWRLSCIQSLAPPLSPPPPQTHTHTP